MRHILVTNTIGTRARNTPANAVVYAHAADSLRHPDPKGPFAKRKWDRWLPTKFVLWALQKLRYEGLVFLHDDADTVVGNIYCQGHRDGLHLFGFTLADELRRTGYSYRMLDAFLTHGWHRGWHEIRLGTGKSDTAEQRNMTSLVRRYFAERRNLPFAVLPGRNGWVMLA